MRGCALVVAVTLVVPMAGAAPPLPSGTLPVPSANWSSNKDVMTRSGNALTIVQDPSKQQTILNWQTFNIAAGSSVTFQQPNAQASALNRIFDANPTVIQGMLSANGKIYLINSNGILFGNGAQVNVGGLVASSLDITDNAFLKGFLNVSPSFQGTTGFVRVEGGANIATTSGGQVLLLAPTVENNGTISTPDGQTILAAGQNLYLSASTDPAVRGIQVQLDHGGTATNLGNIAAPRGNVTLAGLVVNQGGKVQATTTVAANGSIYLVASERPILDVNGNIATPARPGTVNLQSGSVTAVTPELSSAQTSTDQQTFTPSQVVVNGQTIVLQNKALVQAPGGSVSVTAADPNGNANGRIYLDAGATIDVSGTRDVSIPMARNFVDVQLNSNELKDSPLQKGGFLQGKTVTIDVRQGTPLADVSGAIAQIGRTVAERTAVGGTVTLVSDGDVVLRTGSTINVSGGTLDYAGGYGSATKLVDVNGRVVDIGSASKDQIYVAFADTLTRTSNAWGVTQSWAVPPQFNAGYVEGKNAGSVTIQSPAAALDGQFLGQTTRGVYQRAPGSLPSGGLLVLGIPGTGVTPPDFIMPDIVLATSVAALPADFTATTPLPAERIASVYLAGEDLTANGFSRLQFGSNGTITIQPGVNLDLGPQGQLAFHAARIDIGGSVRATGGGVFLEELSTVRQSAGGITLEAGAHLSVAGQWTNDLPAFVDPHNTQVINGGSITMTSTTGVVLAAGSSIDVSAGALYSSTGLQPGTAGSVDIVTNRGAQFGGRATGALVFDGSVTGYGLNQGGTLSLTAGSVAVGTATGAPGELVLNQDAFTHGGFQQINITGIDGVTITGRVAPVLQSYFLPPLATAQASAPDLSGVATVVALPVNQRQPVSLAFSATDVGLGLGNISLAPGAAIVTEPGGSVSLTAGYQMTVDGTISAPGGKIVLTMAGDPTNSDGDDGFHPGQSIWIGQGARLSTAGTAVVYNDGYGNRIGTVFGGGEIDVIAHKGYIITEPGSVVDVSGTIATLDLPTVFVSGVSPSPRAIASDAGSVTLQSREGILLGGAFVSNTFAPSAAGGQFALTLDVTGNNPVGPTYPTTPRIVVLRPDAAPFPSGLTPGVPLDVASYNGLAQLSAASLHGFDSISLKSADEIRVDGNVAVSARRSITLDAPLIGGTAGSALTLDAAYLALGNSDPRYQTARNANAGSAVVSARADTIDLIGRFSTSGIGETQLVANGDIRLQGVLPVDLSVTTQSGGMVTAGNIALAAAQIYPTTASQYAIAAQGGGTVQVRPGASVAPPLSAGGSLTISASDIDIEGTLRAPLGTIQLQAVDALTLGAGSIVSVSASGLTIPFGETLNQTQWVYVLGNGVSVPINAPPQKTISLSGANVSVAQGARVDLSGGGDLSAWEFLPGNGGSADVLAAPGTFAIVPSLNGLYAPRDLQNDAGSSLKPGDAVYLSDVSGLPAGVYTLLPAHYALLPGGYAVTVAPGTQDMVPQQNHAQLDGSYVVAGNRVVLGTPIADARSSGFVVTPASVVRRETQYAETSANDFFSAAAAAAGTPAPVLPRDAGHLLIAATASVNLNGAFNFAASDGAGGQADISAPRIEVVNTPGAPDGSLQIAADSLSGLGAQSLLLGGTRSDSTDGAIAIGATSVVVANDAAHSLRAGEVILVATDQVDIAAGGSIVARGSEGALAATPLGVPGAGALIRVANGDVRAVNRGNAGNGASSGMLSVSQDAQLVADGSIQLDSTGGIQLDPTAQITSSTISVSTSSIALGQVPAGHGGLIIDDALLAQIGQAKSLILRSYGTIDFFGDVALGTPTRPLDQLTLDATGLAGFGNGQVVVQAKTIAFSNSTASAAPAVVAGSSNLQLSATGGDFVLGGGAKAVSGFATVQLSAQGDVRVSGTGTLSTAGDLTFASARLTADNASDQSISAGGAVMIGGSPQALAGTSAPGVGARLSITGTRIDQTGSIELPAGSLTLAATGGQTGDGIHLAPGASISVAGYAKLFHDTMAYAPGGQIVLTSASGNVVLDTGSRVDFSGAPGGGDAGTLQVSAINGTFAANGSLYGQAAASATSGKFVLDVGRIDAFSVLNSALEAGGVGGVRSLRARSGDITVGEDDSVHANTIELFADRGHIDIGGALIANRNDGSGANGAITVFAGNGLSLEASGRLIAQGTAGRLTTPESNARPGHPGTVTLGTTGGSVSLAAGSSIDVSAPKQEGDSFSTAGPDGTVWVRAPQVGSDVAIDSLGSTISGAGSITIEAVRIYSNIARIDVADGPGVLTQAQAQTDVATFMSTSSGITSRLGVADDARVRVVPGLEVQSPGDLVVAADWDLGALASVGGALTLRAQGNLLLNGSLSSGFAGTTPNAQPLPGAGWTMRLVGGSDLSAANPLAVNAAGAGKGGVTLAAGDLVRTSTGNIDVAAGGDVTFASGSSAIYTAGVPVETLAGFALPGNAFFTNGGGDVSISALGNIVTASAPSNQLVNDWLFRQGSLPAGINSAAGAAGDVPYAVRPAWGVSFANFRQNVGALGGGNVTLTAGGNVVGVSAVIPTTGTVSGSSTSVGTTSPSQAIVLGGGNLTVSAGGDVAGGVYYVARGEGVIRAGGQLRAVDSTTPAPVLALGDATFDVIASQGLTLGSVLSPTLIPQGRLNVTNAINDQRLSYFSSYAPDSAVRLLTLTGDLTLADNTSSIASAYGSGLRLPAGTAYQQNLAIYPGTLEAVALQGNLIVGGDQSLTLYPEPMGNLSLLAAGDVQLQRPVYMADVDLATLPQVTTPARSLQTSPGNGTWVGPAAHAATPLHASDTEPARIVALDGSISGTPDRAALYIAKPALIYAGQDVRDVWVYGQNTNASELSAIEAGRDIVYSTPLTGQGQLASNDAGIYWGGPGTLELLAGHNVDLGSGGGVLSRGNLDNPALPASGTNLLVAAGLGHDETGTLREPATSAFVDAYVTGDSLAAASYRTALADYMAQLGQPGLSGDALLAAFHALSSEQQLPFASSVLYSELAAAGEATSRAGFQPGYDAIAKLFPAHDYAGDVRMYLSQIKTERGGDISLLVPGGLVNAGLAVPPPDLRKTPSQLGIVTLQGGSINAFASGDFQVSQSRVFTLGGGNILIWSSDGNIDAGKGAKTATYAPQPTVITRADGSVEFDYNAAASGSGIGVLLTDPTIPPGRVDLIAPSGFVDAGEAGIRSAGDVHIAALQVFNGNNIAAAGTVSGVPSTVDTSALNARYVSVGNVASSTLMDTRDVFAQLPNPMGGVDQKLADLLRVSLNYITVEVLHFGDQ